MSSKSYRHGPAVGAWQRFSRRRFLRGLMAGGSAAVALPILEIAAGRQAFGATSCGSGFPQRFGLFFWGNGNLPPRWTPVGEGDGDDWALSDQLAPLAAVKDKLTVVSGHAVKVTNISPHWSGGVGLLTGQALIGDDNYWEVAAPTIDQVIADEIGGETLYRSMQIGVASEKVFSWSDATTQNFGETDPYTLYQRLFGDTFVEPGSGGIVDPRLGYRRSALDAVMADIGALQASLGASDRQRLEQHLDGVRELEQRLARLQEDPPDYESCTRPDAPETDYPELEGRPQLVARSRAFAHLTAMALACDQTRVLTFQFSQPLNGDLYGDAADGHHSLTHDEGGDQPTVHEITTTIIGELAYLLETLDAVPEGEGTLLDNSLVLACSETSEGKTHSLEELPLLLAGGGCGKLVTGRHVRSYTADNAGHVMLSVLRAMGVNRADWGDGDTYVSDGLSEIEA
ncbi:MAG: DUF1552 domain-containing protein [Alphaproteobacteria bacterium]|nr:DUF1552 domain-containing protein [Alphaproteobacteria bacterium]